MVVADAIKRSAVVQTELVTPRRRYQVFEGIFSQDETIELEIGTLTDVAMFRSDTGVEVTATIATSIVTMTAVIVDIHCVGLAFGTV